MPALAPTSVRRSALVARAAHAGRAALYVALLSVAALGRVHAQDDSYIHGYVAAVLQRDFEIQPRAVTVSAGVVTIRADLSANEREQVRAAIEHIEGVQRVVFVTAGAALVGWTWLPSRQIFAPLIADPRWPRFGASVDRYLGDPELSTVGQASFGELFPLTQHGTAAQGAWQFGIEAGVFPIYDLGASSIDLVNADYMVGFTLSMATGDFSALGRVFHQSSHLGDEYLLRNRATRINLSYESLDLLGAYTFGRDFRVYGGAGYIYRVDPAGIRPWSLQGGFEYIGKALDKDKSVRPVAAFDAQSRQEGNWLTNISPAAGLQFGTGRGTQRNLRVLLSYFSGDSPNGQFYARRIRYVGFGFQIGT